jgi:hypothetical protein
VDPGEPLAAAAQRPARKDLEHGNHLGQGSSILGQHDACAQDDNARLRALGSPLPLAADLRVAWGVCWAGWGGHGL